MVATQRAKAKLGNQEAWVWGWLPLGNDALQIMFNGQSEQRFAILLDMIAVE
jgi:hypothetical protein